MKTKFLYQFLASTVDAYHRCMKSGNTEWKDRHKAGLEYVARVYLPSGSGIDSGTQFDMENSTSEKLVFHTSFHHMNEVGYYDGWSDHTVTVTPSFDGVNIKIGGKNRNDIKDYLHDMFYEALCTLVDCAVIHDRLTEISPRP